MARQVGRLDIDLHVEQAKQNEAAQQDGFDLADRHSWDQQDSQDKRRQRDTMSHLHSSRALAALAALANDE